ncbi:MAG: trigger factor [Tenericutes bacterium HGW-Tenericutes-1]|jgi:trigger factor|nr:MAG: trigger factor [Tenericutes bacterium HGW-Tenericutes-1]
MIIDKLSGSKVRFEVTVTKELFEHALDHAFEEMNQKVEIKGFRKGKAPRSVYEAKYGVESLFEEAINHAMQDTYYDAVVENNISVVAQPKINLDFNKVKRGEDFTYEVVVAVKPEIQLGEYFGLEVKKPSDVATDEEIDATITKELEKNAEMVLKESGALEVTDTAVFDFSGSVDGVKFDGGTSENYELVIGSGQFIPGFEEQMIGMTPESDKDVVVTFPADYHEASLAGKEAVFAVKLHEIKQRVVPTLNDEFVVGLDLENINTVDEYKASVKANLEKGKADRNVNEITNKVVELATANATFEVPEEMIKEESARLHETTEKQIKQYGLEFEMYLQYMGKTKEEYDADLLAQATRTIRSQLVVEAIGKKENLSATKEEIEAKYLEIVEQYKIQNVTLEQAQAAIPETAVVDEIVFKKAIDLLVQNVKFIE